MKPLRALEVDSDVAKESLPEFMDGINAQGVHAESAQIIERLVTPRAMAAGDTGYTVEFSLVDLDPELAADHVVKRFYERGRFVDPEFVLEVVGTHPRAVFQELKNHPSSR